MKDNKYFSTGEFARLANISKQTLIFYDKKGIFSPEYKDKNNFRYYSLKQFDTLDILISLRDIGLSLEDIKDYLDNRTPKDAIDILEKENNLVKKQIQRLQNISKKMENKIDIIKKGMQYKNNLGPYIKECEEEFIIKSEELESDDFKVIMMGIINFISFCKDKQIFDNGYPINAIVNKESIKNNNFTNLNTLYIKVDSKINNKHLHVKPKGTYAFINHIGSYESSHKSYHKLLNFIHENNYEIIGNSYEDGFLDAFTCEFDEDYITQISIQVKNSCKLSILASK